ncbi:PVC-type heme-binding CxxCH protein [Thalassoroseus pseudoceratinae]|uniref:PVC-type heme-binding CxxCH protein n=1 Tax=Thalassoroseus pseudoceratinae TaxID=2713176 RepID=UPI0014249F54|nr:PVC-type heme-binding CxxCH protein [Thalassoroseus pseudoceratinae]
MQTSIAPLLLLLTFLTSPANAEPLVYEGTTGPGVGKHIVFLAGDHEYRSEETLPALARILAKRHGFKCTVLFTVDPKTGEIVPGSNFMPGLEALKTADLMVIFLRFQNFPDEQMQHVVDYLDRAGPVVGLRTATHAFKIPKNRKFARFDTYYPGQEYEKGFGRQVLGETWVRHYGKNHVMSTRLDIVPDQKSHPILRGVEKPWVQAGGYWTDPKPDSTVLALAQPLQGMTPDSPPVEDKEPCPGAWVRNYQNGDGKSGRVFTSTYGASEDILNDDYRRMLINACFWAAGMESKIEADAPIDFVGPYQPVTYRFGGYRKGVKPSDLSGWDSPILPIVEGKDTPKASSKPEKKPNRKKKDKTAKNSAPKDARNVMLNNPPPVVTEDFEPFGIYAKSAPRAKPAKPIATTLPLKLNEGDRIAFIGNTLLERSQEFGHFEAMLHQAFPKHQLVTRTLAWSADEINNQPRPDNFADTEQHLTHEQADVIFAAYGFNESFAGDDGLPEFRKNLTEYIKNLKSKAFNGKSAPRIVLISPIANEDIKNVNAATRNNKRIQQYAAVMKEVAREQEVGFADVFQATQQEMQSLGSDLTINGIHLNEVGNQVFSAALFEEVFKADAPVVKDAVRTAVIDKNREYFRRFRPVNTFYYTGGRNKTYGYLDFLPAMKNFDIMAQNRDEYIWDLAQGKATKNGPDDSNVPPLPNTLQSRGANEWMSAADEKTAFRMDPRFEVNLFAGEEEFPDIANPIQMRWDSRGRLWVSCSTTYPHVYPGNQPNDKLVILEDTDGDGKADKSTVFADDLHIPLSFEFGDGGVYVSEQPNLSFLKDTDGDDRADIHRVVLSGFGTEDSHHALHDFAWTPDGDLIFRESIFHHSQVETPYGPVRQQNSGWFRFEPKTHRLTSFGTYRSTNPWGVTFDDWGQHVASHPVYAAAFHSLDPPYPQQHPAPKGLQAYSGVCGHEFVDFSTFPKELQGGFIKVRYKPTNRVEIHKWHETPFGYQEEYVSDILFSTNLSFIPVDLRFGPRGGLYVCDWYNPVKGHMQYSLRDERRDRHSGRIWRITAKDKPTQDPVDIAGASTPELVKLLERSEYRIRYWAKRELRERNPAEVATALDQWVMNLDPNDPRYRHHQMEAVWTYRGIDTPRPKLLAELLDCEDHHARAAATEQLRYWHLYLPNAIRRLNRAANDSNAIVRMQAAIAASYIGSHDAFEAMLDVFKYPREGHVAYAITCALGSHTLRPHWENNPKYGIAELLKKAAKKQVIKEPTPTASQAQFDSQPDLKKVAIACVPERMLFTVKDFSAKPGQPVKVVFTNGDATDHNLVFVKPNALAEVGMAANEMAKDPRNASSDFIPPQKRNLILHASPMIGPTRPTQVHVLRFKAPTEPGIYPYVCTFPGHWVVMNGVMVVAKNESAAKELLAESRPQVIKKWTMADFEEFAKLARPHNETTAARGMTAFVKARCNQCHVIAGHGVNLGPDLTESVKKLKGRELLQQMIEPSSQIHAKFQNYQFVTSEGRVVTGVIVKEDDTSYQVATNLLTPNTLTTIRKQDVDLKIESKTSPMPTGLLDVLTKDEILDLHAFVESGGFKLPKHLQHHHKH